MKFILPLGMTIFVVLTSLSAMAFNQDAQSQIIDDYWAEIYKKPSYSVSIPDPLCQSLFPSHKKISRPLGRTGETFSLFAFTTQPFDTGKKSILAVAGGPGQEWGYNQAVNFSKLFPGFNVVFFHLRGGGCSSFSKPDHKLDAYLNSQLASDDIDEIRKSYGIKSWTAVVGVSYGTDLARVYAHRYPKRTQNLILEGLSNSGKFVRGSQQSLQQSYRQMTEGSDRILDMVRSRYRQSASLQKLLNQEQFESFMMNLANYLQSVPPNMNYAFMGFWDVYKQKVQKQFVDAGQQMPAYFNPSTFAIITYFLYAGNTQSDAETNDTLITTLLDNFGFYKLDQTQKDYIVHRLQLYSYNLYPFLNPNYLTEFKDSSPLSSRSFYAFNQNDDALAGDDDYCSRAPILVISGTQDSATPLQNARDYLHNKRCASSDRNEHLIVDGGGHGSSLTTISCLQDYAAAFINHQSASFDLGVCQAQIRRDSIP